EYLINQGFGVGAVVIVVWLLCMSMKLLVGYPRFRTLDFTIKSIIALITLSVVVGMVSIGLDSDVNWGGFHGRYINEIIYSYIGWSGAIIISVVLIAIFVVICLRDAIKWVLRKKHAYDERRRIQREAEEAEMQVHEEVEEMKRREQMNQAISGEGEEIEQEPQETSAPENVEFSPDTDTLFEFNDLEDEEEPTSFYDSYDNDPDSLALSEEPLEDNAFIDNSLDRENEVSSTEETYEERSSLKDNSASPADSMEPESSQHDGYYGNDEVDSVKTNAEDGYEEGVEDVRDSEPEDNSINEEIDNRMDQAKTEHMIHQPMMDNAEDHTAEEVMTVNVNQIEKGRTSSSPSGESQLFTHEYKFPTTDYLRPGSDRISIDPDELLENKQKIKQTLLDFGIPITSIEATVGPTVTLYEIRPDTGVKIAKIRGLADDLALSLAANGVRIIAPIPGKGTVGIEVANKDAQTVSMRTIIQSKAYQTTKYKLPVALGSTISNEVYIADLAKMPHLLVAGATGQGKSVGLNAIVTSLLYSKRPEELKFVMVDPKRVEFTLYPKIESYYLAKSPD
ncbi:MAG: DNA translocase FtsK 4TM domain-containing protein, partial [Muribaculaceae bacterium]|nr:DNA translocase FtsK 4TM domain-containing protein [Muribaculaceae bacterium]